MTKMMNWAHGVLIPVVASLPYLPKVGPAPLRYAEPAATNTIAQALPPSLPRSAPVEIQSAVPSDPGPFTFTLPDWPALGTPATTNAASATVVENAPPRATISAKTTTELGVTPEMFVELFRQMAGRNTNQTAVVGVPVYFAPPSPDAPPRSSTATYRSE